MQRTVRPGIDGPYRRSGWSSTDRSVWPNGVVVDAPLLDRNARLTQAVEQLAVQELFTEFALEALAVTVLPRTAGLGIGSPGADAV